MNFSRLSRREFHTQVSSRQRQWTSTSIPGYDCCLCARVGLLGPHAAVLPLPTTQYSSFFLGLVDRRRFPECQLWAPLTSCRRRDAASGPNLECNPLPGACASPGASWLVRSSAHRTSGPQRERVSLVPNKASLETRIPEKTERITSSLPAAPIHPATPPPLWRYHALMRLLCQVKNAPSLMPQLRKAGSRPCLV